MQLRDAGKRPLDEGLIGEESSRENVVIMQNIYLLHEYSCLQHNQFQNDQGLIYYLQFIKKIYSHLIRFVILNKIINYL